MYAAITRFRYADDRRPSAEATEAFLTWLERQSGLRGILNIDTGGGGRVVVWLAESDAAMHAAREEQNHELRRIVEEHYRPIVAGPVEVVAEGPVLNNTLVR